MSTLADLDEEARGLLRQILERQAYRQLVAGNIRGYGLRFLPDLELKIRFAAELDHSLRVLSEVERIYHAIDGRELFAVVRARMERIPYPESRLELACCLALTGRAERAAAQSYLGSRAREFAAVAQSLVSADRRVADGEERLFVDYAAERTHRPQAQSYWNRWLTLSLFSLGRPGTPRDRRAVALGLRTKHAAEVVEEFLDEVEPLRTAAGLTMPTPASIGVELPTGLASRFPRA